MRSHRKIAIQHSIDRPLDIGDGRLDCGVVNGYIDPLVVLEKMHRAGTSVLTQHHCVRGAACVQSGDGRFGQVHVGLVEELAATSRAPIAYSCT